MKQQEKESAILLVSFMSILPVHEVPTYLAKHCFYNVFVRVFPDEINTWIDGLSKAACHPKYKLGIIESLRAWIEQKAE